MVGWARVLGLKDDVLKTSDFSLHLSRQSYSSCFSRMSRAKHDIVYKLFKGGWCSCYRKYAPGDTVLEGLETEARESRKGLWADLQPVPLREWLGDNRFRR